MSMIESEKASQTTKYKIQVERTEVYQVEFTMPSKDDAFAKQYAFAAVNDYEDRDERVIDTERVKHVKEMTSTERITIL